MADAYTGLQFDYDDLIAQVKAIDVLASELLNPQGKATLRKFATDLENARTTKVETPFRVRIGQAPYERLQTVPSDGKYRRGTKGEVTPVYGTLSCVWECIHRNKAIQRQRSFFLIGEASTHLSIRNSTDNSLLAQWQCEVGDPSSPGCHFHSSAKQRNEDGLYSEQAPFPSWLEVPRLPTVCVTPMDALDFLLGELFQDKWWEQVCKSTDARNTWSKGQSRRFEKLLAWQSRAVRDWSGTAWMSLKRAKPPENLVHPD
jgi:hypothetical protein